MRYFTSDLHIGHQNIIKYCNRPFGSVEEMDSVIIRNINSKVGQDDELVIAGDVCLSKDFAVLEAYMSRIVCRNRFLVLGNHDVLPAEQYLKLFARCGDMLRFRPLFTHVNRHDIVIFHYAMRVWPSSHKGAWHLYGHSHGNLPDEPNSLSFDVGVDCHQFFPLSEKEVHEVMKKTKTSPLLSR